MHSHDAHEHAQRMAWLSDRVFAQCAGRTVMELGAFDGTVTQHILAHGPRWISAVEAAAGAAEDLRARFGQDPRVRVYQADWHWQLAPLGPHEVLVVLGCVYHSPAPVQMLEHAVTHCHPQWVWIDNPAPTWGIAQDRVNQPGERQSADPRLPGLVQTLPCSAVAQVMHLLGYRQQLSLTYPAGTSLAGVPLQGFQRQ